MNTNLIEVSVNKHGYYEAIYDMGDGFTISCKGSTPLEARTKLKGYIENAEENN